MQHADTHVLLERALRKRICTSCRFRPDGSEVLPPTVARSCEKNCPIFLYLRPLTIIARQQAGDPKAMFERAIADGICLDCTLSNSPGDYCAERFTRSCPLSCYAPQVLDTIEAVLANPHAPL